MAQRDDPGRRVGQISDLGPARERANPKVKDLSVKDLRDLEQKFKGRDPRNPKVEALQLEDLRNLEDVFQDFKERAYQRGQREGLPGVPTAAEPEDWSVSCCCCTPCCCCAAAEVDPFASAG
jgi:hypothetical protein